ncbi:MAG: DNA alkylation repair protein, partial [Phaeodactylibacter sp.]|nr:DNA alkylation repair protein [Phaeodactylibacter sp.]
MAESRDPKAIEVQVAEIIRRLQSLADPEKARLKQEKYGIYAQNAIGVYHKDLQILAKEFGPDEGLAVALFETGIYECRLLCSKMYRPKYLTDALMESWVQTFENWEITDSFAMGLFAAAASA